MEPLNYLIAFWACTNLGVLAGFIYLLWRYPRDIVQKLGCDPTPILTPFNPDPPTAKRKPFAISDEEAYLLERKQQAAQRKFKESDYL